jgi:hypothetical protein
MDSRPLFLDTNVYLGYAFPETLEKYNPECSRLFEVAPNSRHTSKTVEIELQKKIRERNKLYRELLGHIVSGAPLDTFQPSSGKKSDQEHLEKLVKGFKGGLYDIEFLRTLGATLKTGVDSGLKKTSQPLVKASTNTDMNDDLLTIASMHAPDNIILTDFFEWALIQSQGACFVTGDGGISDNKTAIFNCISYTNDCGLLSILFVTSAARKYCPLPT